MNFVLINHKKLEMVPFYVLFIQTGLLYYTMLLLVKSVHSLVCTYTCTCKSGKRAVFILHIQCVTVIGLCVH